MHYSWNFESIITLESDNVFTFDPYDQYLTSLLYYVMFFSKIHPAENGSILVIPINLPFFLDVTSKLSKHKSGLFDTKYQMSWCIEHEQGQKYL